MVAVNNHSGGVCRCWRRLPKVRSVAERQRFAQTDTIAKARTIDTGKPALFDLPRYRGSRGGDHAWKPD